MTIGQRAREAWRCCRHWDAHPDCCWRRPASANADPAQFDIGSQPLPDALKSFAAQAKMQLLYRYDVVRHATANPVTGQLEKHAALEQMLRGTGLEVIYSGVDTATIRLIVQRQARARAPTRPRRQGGPGSSSSDLIRASGELSRAISGSLRRKRATRRRSRLRTKACRKS